MVPWAVMMSTGRRGCRAWSLSMSWMPSRGSMRRSSTAKSKRPAVITSTACWGWLVAVTSKPMAVRRISRTSRIAAASATIKKRRLIVAEALQLLPQAVQLPVAGGELLAQAHDVRPGGQQASHRVAADQGTPGGGVVGILRQQLIVGPHGAGVVALLHQSVGAVEERRRRPPRRAARQEHPQR